MGAEMNAIELADELDGYEPLGGREFIAKVSTMLRQQAKEIEQLKLSELTDEEIFDAMFLNDTDLMGLLEMMPSVKEKMIQRGRALLKKASEK